MGGGVDAAEDMDAAPRGSVGEVFLAFLKLGVTSFGGPVAHLGYFRDELVTRRRWIDDVGYADLVALCQFLPGPASSQVGFALGLLRAGPFGALAAFLAFTLPSALLLIAFAFGAGLFESRVGDGILTGLKVVAVAIVAQAVWGMARSLAPDRRRAAIAVAAAAVVVAFAGPLGQIGAIALGGIAGLVLCRAVTGGELNAVGFRVPKPVGAVALAIFGVLLVGLPVLAATVRVPGTVLAQGMGVADAFYRAGALVFGGGHVVLPLLEAETVARGWLSHDQFLAGYGAAQAVPGPLFTFSAYLGTILEPEPNGLAGAAIALVAIFLPGFLLLVGVLPYWDAFRSRVGARAVMHGANAAVVGILAAALYDPVFTSAVTDGATFVLALVCFVLLMAWKAPPWVVVVVGAAGGVAIGLIAG